MVVFLVILAICVLQVASAGTRLTLLQEPSTTRIKDYLERLDAEGAPVNHPHAGFTDPFAPGGNEASPPVPPSGFRERTVRCYIGSGKEVYERARDGLLFWRMHDNSSWARIIVGRKPVHQVNGQGSMVTVAKACGGLLWCINPCQVLYERKDIAMAFFAAPGVYGGTAGAAGERISQGADKRGSHDENIGLLWDGRAPKSAPAWASFLAGRKHTGKQSAVAYATKEGHLIQGEERMRVLWFCGRGGDNSVWFEVYSISRGAGCIGALVFPFVQSMQRKFFREQAETIFGMSRPRA